MHSLESDKPLHTCVLAITLLAPLRFAYGLPLILVFIDLPRAFDEVVRNDMRLGLREAGIPNQLWLLLDDLLDQDHVRIHLGDLVSEDFQLASGTAQGRRVSTDMFNGVIRRLHDLITASSHGVGVWGSQWPRWTLEVALLPQTTVLTTLHLYLIMVLSYTIYWRQGSTLLQS